MARAFPQSLAHDYGPEPQAGEWQALRGELVALLDQVETQVARSSRQEPGYSGLAERMRELRYKVGEPGTDDRHREALRSVKRAVDRFSDRDEGYGPEPEPGYAPNPRDTLQSAIQQIRSRQAERAPPPRGADPHFGELAHAVSGISGRLERLESELKVQARSQTGNVKEIADQVAQLSHVVELLAGAVGETGQVKRLEGQIASLAQLITQGPQVDLSTLNQRLDDVSATVGRLADLQVQFANRVENPAQADGMRAVEEGVRNIYDRIDAIEKHTALAPADLEGLTDQMAKFTEAMRNPVQPQGLIELIDALNTRIGDIESRHSDVGGLKIDIEALREAVIEAVDPRFAAIEMQIETLSDRIADRPADIGVGQLEAQVRQLVARMDQTGEQLTGLAKLYSRSEPQQAPDFEALAELVAARTSDAVAQSGVTAGAELNAAGMAEIEARMSRLLEARDKVPDDYSDMQSGIREVNARLARLEASLTERARQASAVEHEVRPPAPPATATPLPPPPAAPPSGGAAPTGPLQPEPEPEPQPTAPVRSDAMPKNPADEAPLSAKPFGEPGPVRAALEAKNGPRKRHPGLEEPPLAETAAPAPAAEAPKPPFDPAAVVRPPRPVSSFDKAAREVLPAVEPATLTPMPASAPAPEPEPQVGVEPPSANTFIAAARRAAQRQQPAARPSVKAARPEPGGTSLIARALASFHGGKPDQPKAETEAGGEPAGRRLAGDKPPRDRKEPKAAKPHALPPAPEPSVIPLDAPAEESKESFLTRHRKPILLGASLVAICFLTLNLISQRLGDDGTGSADGAPADVGALQPSRQSSLAPQSTGAAAPRIIPRVDSLATASIDPGAARRFTPTTAVPAMPSAFTSSSAVPASRAIDAATQTGSLPAPDETVAPPLAELASPIQVELPPAALGPEALRQAAADGDARAQFEIAAIYTEGRAVPEDLAAAAVWYERAAAQGFAPAQYRLGNLYEHGRGVERDLEQARLWYQRAADAGNRMSMHNLAALYAGGELGEQQFSAAAEWFEQAAQRGMKDSQFNLGMLYARGLGVTQDLEASYKWFSIAAGNGDADAAKARDDIARSLDAEAVQRIDRSIEAWKPAPIDLAANFAPIGTWSETFDPGAPIVEREVIKSVQTALSKLGFDMGTPDGVAGPKTTEAIRQFERATGMSESGQINPRLLAVLGSQPV